MSIGDAIVPVVKTLISPAVRLVLKRWRAFRFGVRLSVHLDWDTIPFHVPGQQSQYWRSVNLTVVASKDEEFVIADREIEVRRPSEWRWVKVPCGSKLIVSTTVEKNRKKVLRVSGPSLSKLLRRQYSPTEALELRATLRDHHRVQARSDAMVVKIQQLEEEQYR